MSTNEDNADAHGKEADIDRLINELDRRLQEIETEEILNSQTSEELEARGFISKGAISIQRSGHMQTRINAGFCFPQGVKFGVCSPVKSSSGIEAAIMENLTVVTAGSITITHELSGTHAGASPESIYGKAYLDDCNLTISIAGKELQFVPRVDGRLVVAGERLYLMTSNHEGMYTVRFIDNNTKAVVDFAPPRGSGRMPTVLDVQEELLRLGVTTGVFVDAIEIALAKVQDTKEPQCDVVVALGKQPVNGEDGKIIFRFDINATSEEYRILPDGRIDYRKNANIPIVNKNDILAVLTPPQEGTDGFDLFGAVVTAVQGQNAVLCPGMNVIVDEQNVCRATCSGQVSLNGSVLDVLQHFVVEGDVDYSSGNVKFNGNVTVKGNIHPGFEVIADGDIEVYGTSEGALLKAGRDIRVEGGIIGRGDGSDTLISCGRDLMAKHIQNGYIEAQGDVIVKMSIVQSSIKAGGMVLMRGGAKAAIIGGTVSALNGIAAVNIGCEYGVRTQVEAGNDYLASKACNELEEAILFSEKNIKKIDQVFLSLKTLIKSGAELDAEKQAKMHQIKDKRKQLHNYRRVMTVKKDMLQKQSLKNPGAKICARQTVFSDVVVRILDAQKLIKDSVNRTCFKYDGESCELISAPFSETP